jgi:hypothetical protein
VYHVTAPTQKKKKNEMGIHTLEVRCRGHQKPEQISNLSQKRKGIYRAYDLYFPNKNYYTKLSIIILFKSCLHCSCRGVNGRIKKQIKNLAARRRRRETRSTRGIRGCGGMKSTLPVKKKKATMLLLLRRRRRCRRACH